MPKSTFPPLSHCALKFATAIADPWSEMARGACIPLGNRPTRKAMGYMRGTITVGTNNLGFLKVSPSVASDANYCYYTDSTYTGNSGNTIYEAGPVLTTGVNTNVMSNLPYATSDLWANDMLTSSDELVTGRIVSVGISLVYTGTELDRGGQYFCYTDPLHKDLSDYSVNELASRSETDIKRVTEKKCRMSLFPSCEEEMDFQNLTAALASGAGNPASADFERQILYPWNIGELYQAGGLAVGVTPAVIFVEGKPGNTFYYEIVTHVEYVGKPADPSATPVELDQKGANIVMAAAGKVPTMKGGGSFGAKLYSAIKSVGKEIVPVAARVAEKALLTLLV